jgi:TPR repeat protein
VTNVGDPDAMMGLSKWYLCGAEGFSQNEELAFKYADSAAKLGLPQAEFAMGIIFMMRWINKRLFLRSWRLRSN